MPESKQNKTSDSFYISAYSNTIVPECSADCINKITTLVNHAANQGESLQGIIRLLNKETRKAFSGNGSGVYLFSEDKKYLELQHLNLPDELVKRIKKLIGMKMPTLKVRFGDDSQTEPIQ